MYTLDLDRLNLRSPYYVWKVKDGVYAFDTDYEYLTTTNSATPSLPSSKSSSVPMAVCYSISVPQATVCRSIVSICAFDGLIPTSIETSTKSELLKT